MRENIKLLFQAITKYVLGLVMIGLLLFLPAGTFNYWNAWLFIALLFIPMFILGIILWFKDKELLRKRLKNYAYTIVTLRGVGYRFETR